MFDIDNRLKPVPPVRILKVSSGPNHFNLIRVDLETILNPLPFCKSIMSLPPTAEPIPNTPTPDVPRPPRPAAPRSATPPPDAPDAPDTPDPVPGGPFPDEHNDDRQIPGNVVCSRC